MRKFASPPVRAMMGPHQDVQHRSQVDASQPLPRHDRRKHQHSPRASQRDRQSRSNGANSAHGDLWRQPTCLAAKRGAAWVRQSDRGPRADARLERSWSHLIASLRGSRRAGRHAGLGSRAARHCTRCVRRSGRRARSCSQDRHQPPPLLAAGVAQSHAARIAHRPASSTGHAADLGTATMSERRDQHRSARATAQPSCLAPRRGAKRSASVRSAGDRAAQRCPAR